MSNCKPKCQLCNNLVISQSVTVVTVGGTDTLVIDLPVRNYTNCCKYCIIIAQAIPATATILMPVAFSIGGVTTTVFPFVDECCKPITACGIRTRTRYSTIVSTDGVTGSFRYLGKLNCYPTDGCASLPIPTAAAAVVTPTTTNAVAVAATPKAKNTTKTTGGETA